MTKSKQTEILERPVAKYMIRDRVEIREEGIRPWRATVTATKYSPVSGWWYEVARDAEEPNRYNVTEDLVTLVVGEDGLS